MPEHPENQEAGHSYHSFTLSMSSAINKFQPALSCFQVLLGITCELLEFSISQ